MKWGLIISFSALTIIPVGYINIKKEKMRHLKSIEEFKKINEQLFRQEAEAFAKLAGAQLSSSPAQNSTSTTGGTGNSTTNTPTGKISTEKKDIGAYGKFTAGKSKNSPLVVVFGGINVNNRKSGDYMYDYFNKTGDSFNLFVATDHNINGEAAYSSLKSKLSEQSINPSKKILYLFSGGYNPGMKLLKSVGASEFDLIYLVDIWMGNSNVSKFYEELARNNKQKVLYFYTGFGANNKSASDSLVRTLSFSKLNGTNSHMETNTDAVDSLLSKA